VHAGNVFSLVKRTLFEANSKACRFGRESLTSVLTGRLLLASPRTVNPGAANIALKPGLGSHAKTACNFLSPFCKDEEESAKPFGKVNGFWLLHGPASCEKAA
jgi:hypothetical protein